MPDIDATPQPLAGVTVGVTADRRWEEQAALFTKRGATVLHGPTMRTIDLSHDDGLRRATDAVLSSQPDYVIATTGMGMRLWLAAAKDWGLEDDLAATIQRARLIARGAKSASAMRGAGFTVWWQAPGERMDDIVARLKQESTAGQRAVLQLFDPGDHPSTAMLRTTFHTLLEVPVYRWLLPDDRTPADRLIEATVAGEVQVVTFTSQPAVHHLFALATDIGAAGALRERFNTTVMAACIGPVCAEAALAEGISDPRWPEPPRLPAMVRQVTDLIVANR